ncbi:linear amide C-N hydrolase [Novipirellula artificiosorum]|uniref:Choloylglycine hydrolase/NAAA C-terminal domain-containing protein n=1 Tax=Novipirellula artificiosorum TaxID=2528016 RepID=A0A5C6E0T2_9BACT|nr:linear amide C-N hydrolase [Novipirellula artificiosorum]TWU40779.1 hypothetical protein Poly41_16140 [Novipirellula artificiosorum]
MNRSTSTFFRIAVLLVSVTVFGSAETANACTVMRFYVDGEALVARNHDWPFGEGLMVVNHRGIEKTAISAVQPTTWVSKHGSVSFVQFGREIPFAGMNEAGLTVDLLQLGEASFPAPTRKGSSVNVIQWVQYQLDTASSVKQVVASLEHVYPLPMLPSVERVHYFVTDVSGDVAVIEFLDGKPVVQHGTETSPCALANSTWQVSCQAYTSGQVNSNSEHRYCKAVNRVGNLPERATTTERIDYAFDSLRSVWQQGLTQWNIVYQPGERRVWFKTRVASQRRYIDLDDLSFDADQPTLVLDMDADLKGDLQLQLQPYTSGMNQRLVDFAFGRLMPEGFARVAIKQLVLSYPETLRIAPSPVSER